MIAPLADHQAMAFYTILTDWAMRRNEDDYKQNFEFHSLLNGRERSIAMVYTYGYEIAKEQLVIKFGEHRNSDSFFVEYVVMERNHWRAPTNDNFSEASYARRRHFGYANFKEAFPYVMTLVDGYQAGGESMLNTIMMKAK